MSSPAAALSPQFPWDHVVPSNPFWNDIDNDHTRAFLSCYTPAQIEDMHLNPSQPLKEKLQQLRTILASTLQNKEASVFPSTLHSAEYRSWRTLKTAICTIDHALDPSSTSELDNAQYFYDNGPNGGKDMSALTWISHLYERDGDYAKGEASTREVLPWIIGHEVLGPDSPQALGCMRRLVNVVGKQGRFAEAEDWVEKCTDSIERMGQTKFAKYQQEEIEELERVVKVLEGDRAEAEKK